MADAVWGRSSAALQGGVDELQAHPNDAPADETS